MAITIDDAKGSFGLELGLDWSANIHAFIQYYQAKLLEEMRDQQKELLEELIDKVDELDNGI